MMDMRGSQELPTSNSQLSVRAGNIVTPMRKRPSLGNEQNYGSSHFTPGPLDHRVPLVSQSDIKFPLYKKDPKKFDANELRHVQDFTDQGSVIRE